MQTVNNSNVDAAVLDGLRDYGIASVAITENSELDKPIEEVI